MAELRLVAGLGNPGNQYASTRHNVGFMVLDRLAKEEGLQFSQQSAWRSSLARWNNAWLVKPLTFMNLSGDALQSIAQYYKITPEQTLIVVDDVALPLGRLRLRGSGSDGGHNGLRSIIERLGDGFMRLRIGIGQMPGGDELLDHVLGRFTEAEQPVIAGTIGRSVDAIRHLAREDLASAMNKYNRTENS
jgi:peptidyl-tRNA hydrolase, PTH1 family